MNKVLLVDDDPHIRYIAKLSMERIAHWEVVTASSGYQVLDVLDKEAPEVVLLDVMMPGMDGLTTLNKIKESGRYAHLPVVFITSKVQEDERLSYQKLGAAGLIPKPFDPKRLPSEVERIVGDWKEHLSHVPA